MAFPTARHKLIFAILVAVLGLTCFIIGMVRVKYSTKVEPLVQEAQNIVDTYESAHGPISRPPQLRDSIVSYSGKPTAPTFDNINTVQLYYYASSSSSSSALPEGVPNSDLSNNNLAFVAIVRGKSSSSFLELAEWPPTIDITYDFAGSTEFAKYYSTTPSSIPIDIQPQKTVNDAIRCTNASCNVDSMGSELCIKKYKNATWIPATNFSTGQKLSTCNGVLPSGQTAGTLVPDCGTCTFNVRLLSFCQAVTPYLTGPDTNKWAWRASSDNHSYFDCPEVLATKWQTGLVGEPNAPSTINITMINSESAVVQLDRSCFLHLRPT